MSKGAKSLADRMRAAGLLTIDEMMAGTALDGFIRDAGVHDLDSYGQWLDTKYRNFLTMQAKRELNKDPEDDMYEWVIAHAAAFQEARINFNAARHAKTEQQPLSHDWDDQDKCRRCGDRDWYASATCKPKQQPAVQGEPVGRVKTVGGYPDESEHTVEWLCKYKGLKDGDLLYTAPQPEPDVAHLVEELHKLLMILRSTIGGAMWTLDDEEEELAVRTEKAIAALAAYRNQGDDVWPYL